MSRSPDEGGAWCLGLASDPGGASALCASLAGGFPRFILLTCQRLDRWNVRWLVLLLVPLLSLPLTVFFRCFYFHCYEIIIFLYQIRSLFVRLHPRGRWSTRVNESKEPVIGNVLHVDYVASEMTSPVTRCMQRQLFSSISLLIVWLLRRRKSLAQLPLAPWKNNSNK